MDSRYLSQINFAQTSADNHLFLGGSMEVISGTQRQVLVAGASLASREGGYHLNHCPLCRAFLGLDFGGGLFFTTFRAAFCGYCEFRHESHTPVLP